MALIDGIKVVAAQGTPEALAATFTPARWLKVYAHDDNTGAHMWIGSSAIVNTLIGTERGMRVQKLGETGTEHPLFIPGPLDLSKVYVDATTSGDSVTFMYDDNAEPILAGT